MELLIPGLILVAVMVYASTKIKKSVAKAFEAEQIEAPDFFISKPEGLLSRAETDPPYAFQAYSKEFARTPNAHLREITADLSVLQNTDGESEIARVKRAAEQCVSKTHNGGTGILETREIADGARAAVFYRIEQKGGQVFNFRVRLVGEPDEENLRKIYEILDGFHLK